jgi:4-diphosphocytidyl-2-C-methyl-D-erythritol kinase
VTVQSYPAPAKLNLMLRVVGRRPDGYHLLQTVLRFLDYGDEVRIAVRGDGAIRRVAPLNGIVEDDDLSLRAARALKAETGSALGADIEVVKRLPVGGGLGGGSSDAATVLLALNHLWATRLSRARLQALGLTLGADVPFFVFGESAFAQGVGEIVEPLPLPPAWYVVLTPPVAVPTRPIFDHPDLKRDSKPIKIQGFSAGGGLRNIGDLAENDLEPLVCRLYPEVARHLDWLKQHAPALMTGTGASVFAAFDTEQAAREVMARAPADMQGFVARGLDRHPLQELADRGV